MSIHFKSHFALNSRMRSCTHLLYHVGCEWPVGSGHAAGPPCLTATLQTPPSPRRPSLWVPVPVPPICQRKTGKRKN